MKKKFILFLFCNIFFVDFNAQVGIGTDQPNSTIDIRTENSLNTNKAIKISNSENSEVFTLYNNGNLSFKGAFMPNNNPGEPGQFLISKGGNTAPEWKSITFPQGSKQINELFSIVSNTNSTSIPENTFTKINFNTINLPSESNYGVWNQSDLSFTVKVDGLYIITAGCSMYTGANQPRSSGAMRIFTANDFFEYGTITTQNSNGTQFWDNANGELVKYLNAGDKIWIEGATIYPWNLSNAFLHLKYIQL